MRAHLDQVPPRGWWVRSVVWLVGGWVCAFLVTAAASLSASLVAGGTVSDAMVGFTVGLAPYLIVWYGLVALPILPVLLGWGAFGPALGRIERTPAGVAAGTALVAVFAMYVSVEMFGGAGVAPGTRLEVWGIAWAGLLLPRVACRRLWPGAFGGSGSITA